jgi:hypothetical protein
MALRSTPKPAPQAATPRLQNAFYFPGWTSGPEFCGYLLQFASPVDHKKIRVHVQGRALTVTLGSADAENTLSGYAFHKGSGRPVEPAAALNHRFVLPEKVNSKKARAAWSGDTLIVRFPCTDVKAPAVIPPMIEPDLAPAPVISIPIDFGSPVTPIIRRSKPHGRTMVHNDQIAVSKDGTLVKNGTRYYPANEAASSAQTTPSTLLRWIKTDTEIGGQPIESYYFVPLDRYFVSEQSIQRIATRFIKLPSEQPAGSVIIGQTPDHSGYISLPDARAILGISNRTMYLWATETTAPTDKPLDIIKDPISEHLYVREKDVYRLKPLIPKTGLSRGRRPQLALQP